MAHKKIDLDNWSPVDPTNPLKSLAIEVNNNFDAMKTLIDAIPAGPKGDTGPAGVGIKGYAAGYVDAGQFITLDNLKFTVTTSGSRGLSCATVSGTVPLAISGTIGYINGGGASATNWASNPVYTTTPSSSWFGWSFPNAGDGSTYLINDYTNKRFYRVNLMIGPGYLGNFISIERLY